MHFLLCIIISISWSFVYEMIDRSVEAGTVSLIDDMPEGGGGEKGEDEFSLI